MLGVFLTSVGTFFSEISASIGKEKVLAKEASIYAIGCFQIVVGFTAFLGIALLWPGSFLFSLASLPIFLFRAGLEIVQAHMTLLAIVHADRTTFGFTRILTLPILFCIDMLLQYRIHSFQMIGIAVILIGLVVAFSNHGVKKQGIGYSLFTAVNASVTLSLYKYDITNYNSVVAEQLLINAVLLAYFFIGSRVVLKERPFSLLRRRTFASQSLAEGVAFVVDSFAYSFAPASIITAAKRSTAVLWAILSGRVYFREEKLVLKLGIFFLLSLGIILLVV